MGVRSACVALFLCAALPLRGTGAEAAPSGKDLWLDRTDVVVPPTAGGAPDFAAIARFARQSVVSITATGNDETTPQTDSPTAREFFERFYGGADPPTKGMASGFVVRSDGYILTNEHVVEDAGALAVTLGVEDDGRSYPAVVVGRDDLSDLALIKIDAGRPLQALPLGNSDTVAVGDWVTTIGNPFGLSNSLSVGVISFVGRRDINPSGRPGYYDFLQTDAAINPGNSGGPLVDGAGRVIGISAAVNSSGQGIGFAIPINMAKDVLPALYNEGSVRRSFLGISIQDLSPELAESFRVGQGVVVTEVTPEGPAARGGIQVGDVIRAFDGEQIQHAWRLRWLASSAGVGKHISLSIRRHDADEVRQVTLAPLPGEGAGSFHREAPPKPREDLAPLGFAVSGWASAPNGRGLRVSVVDPQSQAYVAGLREGDLILMAGDRQVHAQREIEQVARPRGAVVRFLIQRGVRPLFIAFHCGAGARPPATPAGVRR
jgi:serine protease Do